MRRWVRGLAWVGGVGATLLATVAALAVAVAAVTLRPAAGEWGAPVAIGPFTVRVSVPAAWHIATHPVVLQATSGRTWTTRAGPVRWEPAGPGHWRAVCAPCRAQRPEWGDTPVTLSRVEWAFGHAGEGRLRGHLTLGDGAQAVRGHASMAMHRDGAVIDIRFDDVPISDAYALLASVVPEVGRAAIAGRAGVHATLQLPSRHLSIVPRVTGFRVDGLGTQALATAVPACGPAPAHGHGRWLPRAVLAAEDQRFHEHTGFDAVELAAAWSANQASGGIARGGSTLSQQVARLVYTGAARSPVRKLRELLYAVELDRTLGKARVLQLYLAIAPWGEGRCGAEAASQAYLHKPAHRLSAVEAAWLASLLHAPDRERSAQRRDGRVNVARVDHVLDQMRPLPPRRDRRVPPGWLPPS